MWADLTPCTKTCGNGTKSSIRICDNPAPANSGNYCEGDDQINNKNCNDHKCPGNLIDFFLNLNF